MTIISKEKAVEQNISEGNINPLNDVLFKFVMGKEERKGLLTVSFKQVATNF